VEAGVVVVAGEVVVVAEDDVVVVFEVVLVLLVVVVWGLPQSPTRDGTAFGPFPISTRFVPQLAA
jgi:hypothetical protein